MSYERVLYKTGDIKHVEDFKLLGIFNSILIISLLLCDVFIFKTIYILGFTLAISGVIFPITSLMMICINEIYGHKQAGSSLINLITAQVCFLIGLILIPKIPSPPGYIPLLENSYRVVFHDVWRVFLSSPFGIAITLYLSSIINSKLKTFFWGRFLFLRVFVNSIMTTAILVAIIYPINFYHILSWNKIALVCLHTYCYKVLMSVVVLAISLPMIKICRKIEKRYVFDINISFNPFHLCSNKSSGINLYDEFSH